MYADRAETSRWYMRFFLTYPLRWPLGWLFGASGMGDLDAPEEHVRERHVREVK